MLSLGWDYVNLKPGCFLDCAMVWWCIIILILILIIVVMSFFDFSSFWVVPHQGKKNPWWILATESFIKRQWNKIGARDEIDSSGLDCPTLFCSGAASPEYWEQFWSLQYEEDN